jgi:hypothetical protein
LSKSGTKTILQITIATIVFCYKKINMDIKKWDLPVQSLFKTISVYIKKIIGVLRRCKSIGASSMLCEGGKPWQ